MKRFENVFVIGTGTLVLGLGLALPAHAASLFDFENQPIGTETPFTLSAGGLTATFAGPADVDPGAFGISSNFSGPTGFAYRLMTGDFLTVGSAFGASGAALTITFGAPVTGFSLDFGIDDPRGTSTLSFVTSAGGAAYSAGTLTSGFRYPEGSFAYSGPAFTSLVLQSTAIDFQIDNLGVVAAVAAVPEPSTWALLACGLGALGWAARARRSARPGS